MKVLFIGLGSIGKRHIRDFYNECLRNEVVPEIYVLRRQKGDLGELSEIITAQVTDMPDDYYDVIFVTNPTKLHYDALAKCKGRGKKYFVEKPIFDACSYDLKALDINDHNTYIAAPMRHTKTYKTLKNIVDSNKVFSSRVICSSYLPDWRPGIDYRKNYSALRDMGGGVSLDLIHEIDYIHDLFGKPLCSFCVSGKFSDLEITSDDLSVYILKYQELVCEVHLDYFGKKSTRTCELFTSSGTYVADFYKENITLPNGDVIDCHVEQNEEFIEEMKYFFSFAMGKTSSINPPSLAMNNLTIATKGVYQSE